MVVEVSRNPHREQKVISTGQKVISTGGKSDKRWAKSDKHMRESDKHRRNAKRVVICVTKRVGAGRQVNTYA